LLSEIINHCIEAVIDKLTMMIMTKMITLLDSNDIRLNLSVSCASKSGFAFVGNLIFGFSPLYLICSVYFYRC